MMIDDAVLKIEVGEKLCYFWPHPSPYNSIDESIKLPNRKGMVDVSVLPKSSMRRAMNLNVSPLTIEDERLCHEFSGVLESQLVLNQLRLVYQRQSIKFFLSDQKTIELNIDAYLPSDNCVIIDMDTELIIGNAKVPDKKLEEKKSENCKLRLVADQSVPSGSCLFNLSDLIDYHWITINNKVLFTLKPIGLDDKEIFLVGSAGSKRSCELGTLRVSMDLLEHEGILNTSYAKVLTTKEFIIVNDVTINMSKPNETRLTSFKAQDGSLILPAKLSGISHSWNANVNEDFIVIKDGKRVKFNYTNIENDIGSASFSVKISSEKKLKGIVLVQGEKASGKTEFAKAEMMRLSGIYVDFQEIATASKLERRLADLVVELKFTDETAPLALDHLDWIFDISMIESMHEDERWALEVMKDKVLEFVESSKRLVILSSSLPISDSRYNSLVIENVSLPSADRSIYAATDDDRSTCITGWGDLRGQDNCKQQLEESIVWPIKYNNLYKANNFDRPSGVLLYGPSGSGKTMLMNALSTCLSNVKIIKIRGPELISKYIGSSEQAVRQIFEEAGRHRPSIIMIDEIDAMATRRGNDRTGVTDRIVNQLLTEIDGTTDRSGIFIVGTTSRKEIIDPALLRSGRIDKHIELAPPDEQGIQDIIQSYLEYGSIGDQLVELMKGLYPAQIQGLLREASFSAESDEHILDRVQSMLSKLRKEQNLTQDNEIRATFA